MLVVPPFAEEMNKSRRMVTEVALGLAAAGVATVLPDLYGTGDSAGDFSDGDWASWRIDLTRASEWAAARAGSLTGLLAVRLGCALAADAVSRQELPAVPRTVLWQPVFDGPRFLTQFLRLRIAAGLMETGRKETLAELKARLQAGETLEIAGYGLPGRLAADLERLRTPTSVAAGLGELLWLEVVADAEAPLPLPSARLLEASTGAGRTVAWQTFAGEPFWASTEIVLNGALVAATVGALSSVGRVPDLAGSCA